MYFFFFSMVNLIEMFICFIFSRLLSFWKFPGHFFFFRIFFWGGGHTWGMWKFLGQGLSPCHRSDLCRRSDNPGSFTRCATVSLGNFNLWNMCNFTRKAWWWKFRRWKLSFKRAVYHHFNYWLKQSNKVYDISRLGCVGKVCTFSFCHAVLAFLSIF